VPESPICAPVLVGGPSSRPEVLEHDIGTLNQFGQDLSALVGLEVEREAPLVAVEHREVEAVDARNVAELGARDIATARQFDLDNVRAEPGQDLGATGTRLNVGEIENADAGQRLIHH
jgi:hypothetical protein